MIKKQLFALTTLATVASTASLGHMARAAVGTHVERLADTVLAVSEPETHAPQRFRLNGAEFELSTQTVTVSPAQAVEDFLSDCKGNREHPRGFSVSWHGKRGPIAVCMAPEDNRLQEVSLLDRLAQAAHTGDLSTVGQLQMIRAMPSTGGAAVVSIRGLGELPLQDMFPKEGDAVGDDLPGIPRPEQARRILSALSPREGHGFAVYSSTLSLPDAQQAYAAAIERAGMRAHPGDTHLRVSGADGTSFAVAFSRSDLHTLISVVAMDLPPAP